MCVCVCVFFFSIDFRFFLSINTDSRLVFRIVHFRFDPLFQSFFREFCSRQPILFGLPQNSRRNMLGHFSNSRNLGINSSRKNFLICNKRRKRNRRGVKHRVGYSRRLTKYRGQSNSREDEAIVSLIRMINFLIEFNWIIRRSRGKNAFSIRESNRLFKSAFRSRSLFGNQNKKKSRNKKKKRK